MKAPSVRGPYLPDRLHRQFIRYCANHLLGARFFLRDGHRPSAGHKVAPDFIGLGVANGPDPDGDRYLIEALEALGIRRVRLDYSYQSPGSHAERLLTRLLDESFDVLLHLVQPYAEARLMPGDDARDRWRTFVVETLDRWGEDVRMVEVGSTINRKRWSGYELNGWLAAWQIAAAEVRRRNMVLLGPNVTDFEPYFNEALLSILKRHDLLPDIHSNNLFVERAGEPEAWDHKILGAKLAALCKFNLVRKARVLDQVARRYGLNTTVSTNAYWTMKRIGRLLPNPEQKQADYLARYFALAAASGALAHVYWGSMIGHNEGIIDSPAPPRPERPAVTFYGETTGVAHLYRQRPAFDALRQVNHAIAGCDYQGPAATGRGLEVHPFRKGSTQTHVAWTHNARCAVTRQIYREEDLACVSCHDRDGNQLPHTPELITESPVYLSWNGQPDITVRDTSAAMRDVRIAAYRCDGQHYYHCDENWHGMVFAASRDEGDKLIELLHPERIGAAPERRSLRKARNAIWAIADPRDPKRSLAVKAPRRMRLNKRVLDRYKPSKARRSWNGACELLRRGIPTPAPIAWFERIDRIDMMNNWYVCELLEGGSTVRQYFTAYASGQTHYHGIAKEDFFQQCATFIRHMHQRGVYFRDMTGGNILVQTNAEGAIEFSLIDTGRAQFSIRETPMRQRLSDLKRACRKLDWDSRNRFLQMYMRTDQNPLTAYQRVVFHGYDLKTATKRLLKPLR